MVKKTYALFSALVVCAAFIAALLTVKIFAAHPAQSSAPSQRPSTTPDMQERRWEYRILSAIAGEYAASRHYDVLQSQINQLAGQGFEIDSLEAATIIKGGGAGGSESSIIVVMKKERK